MQWLEVGRFAPAREVLEQAWRRRRDQAGPLDPVTVEAQFYLAQSVLALGDPHRSLDLIGPVARRLSEALGPEEPRLLIVQAAFASALRESGHAHKALPILRAAADSLRRQLVQGGDNRIPRTNLRSVLHQLCTTLLYLRRSGEARAACGEALDASDMGGTIGNAAVLTALGQAHLLDGRAEDAVRVLTAARATFQRFDLEHPELATVEATSGLALIKLGRWQLAEENLRSALARYRNILGTDHPETVAVMRQLAQAVRRQKRKQEAQLLEADARRMAIRIQSVSPESIWSMRGR